MQVKQVRQRSESGSNQNMKETQDIKPPKKEQEKQQEEEFDDSQDIEGEKSDFDDLSSVDVNND